jgi:hypothetical protein
MVASQSSASACGQRSAADLNPGTDFLEIFPVTLLFHAASLAPGVFGIFALLLGEDPASEDGQYGEGGQAALHNLNSLVG